MLEKHFFSYRIKRNKQIKKNPTTKPQTTDNKKTHESQINCKKKKKLALGILVSLRKRVHLHFFSEVIRQTFFHHKTI